MNTFDIKTKIQFGKDALDLLKQFHQDRVCIITDPFMVESGMIKRVTSLLSEKDCMIFSNIVPDPPISLITEGVSCVTQFQPSVVIALGGGSAIDAAKAIMHFSKKIGGLNHMIFVAIPTTSGTGSEVTSFAVITDEKKGVKYPLVDDALLPDIAILDGTLVKSVPASIVADTGMDVLTHALESYVSTASNAFTDALAEKAVQLVFRYLKRSAANANDEEAREQMHYASCIAGLAFNQASLGLNHAIAHNIGGKLHIAHGRTNAILLPHIVAYNANIVSYHDTNYHQAAVKYAALAQQNGFGGSSIRMSVKNLIHEITKLQKELPMPRTLKECGIPTEKVREQKKDIAMGALLDICFQTNPRAATLEEVMELIEKVV